MAVGLCHLRILISTCEQSISDFLNIFFKVVLVILYGMAS